MNYLTYPVSSLKAAKNSIKSLISWLFKRKQVVQVSEKSQTISDLVDIKLDISRIRNSKKLNSGAFGTVYDYGSGMAVKVISRKISTGFEREAELSVINEVENLKKFSSLGIVPTFYGFDYDKRNFYIVTEKFEDDTAYLIWESSDIRDLEFIKDILKLIRTAVYTHGLICYDVKPSNVVYRSTRSGKEFKLIDLESCCESKLLVIAKDHSIDPVDLQYFLNIVTFFSLMFIYKPRLYDQVLARYFTSDKTVKIFRSRKDLGEIFDKISETDFMFRGYINQSEGTKERFQKIIRCLKCREISNF